MTITDGGTGGSASGKEESLSTSELAKQEAKDIAIELVKDIHRLATVFAKTDGTEEIYPEHIRRARKLVAPRYRKTTDRLRNTSALAGGSVLSAVLGSSLTPTGINEIAFTVLVFAALVAITFSMIE